MAHLQVIMLMISPPLRWGLYSKFSVSVRSLACVSLREITWLATAFCQVRTSTQMCIRHSLFQICLEIIALAFRSQASLAIAQPKSPFDIHTSLQLTNRICSHLETTWTAPCSGICASGAGTGMGFCTGRPVRVSITTIARPVLWSIFTTGSSELTLRMKWSWEDIVEISTSVGFHHCYHEFSTIDGLELLSKRVSFQPLFPSILQDI